MIQVSRQKQVLQEEKSFDNKPEVKLFITPFQVYGRIGKVGRARGSKNKCLDNYRSSTYI